MYCTSFISSLSTLNKPNFAPEKTSSEHGLVMLSVPSEPTCQISGGRYARLRKSTSQSKLMLVAFSLGARCRRALSKRKAYPRVMVTSAVEITVNETLSNAVPHISRSPSPGISESHSSLSQRLSYASSFVSVSYTETARSSLSSELSFWCRGPEAAWDCDLKSEKEYNDE